MRRNIDSAQRIPLFRVMDEPMDRDDIGRNLKAESC